MFVFEWGFNLRCWMFGFQCMEEDDNALVISFGPVGLIVSWEDFA